MKWIVLGENNGRIQLVSKRERDGERGGLLPKGSYLTVEKDDTKFILRVADSVQNEPYSPSPMIVDMDLSPLKQDQKCKNIISSYRVKDVSHRTDGLIDYIEPQLIARRSNQDEVDLAMDQTGKGPTVFPATVHGGKNQLLIDDEGSFITARLPDDMFFHQTLVCGKTGSGKTVALKYLAQYFIEELEGAVLAINVKDVDFLKMDKASNTVNAAVEKEWEMLDEGPRGINNFVVYYPANTTINQAKGINQELCKKITLNVSSLDPNALTGLLRGITDIASKILPNIFRYWKNVHMKREQNLTFRKFYEYFQERAEDRFFETLSVRGERGGTTLPHGTYMNIDRNLNNALDFFDNVDADTIDETDILIPGQLSVIDVTGSETGVEFGSILLRDLLSGIVKAKSDERSKVPVLIIIDEVHWFYGSAESKEALGDLDVICRTGRSQKIGVIFSSQNPTDIPSGLSRVINTKILFKSDVKTAKSYGINISNEEMESLKKGYAVANIHGMSQLKLLKFPLSFSGVFEER